MNAVNSPPAATDDAANTGQFSDLPITAVEFTLGIFNRKARDKNHLWRILGYLPEYTETASRGKRIVAESGHTDALDKYTDSNL